MERISESKAAAHFRDPGENDGSLIEIMTASGTRYLARVTERSEKGLAVSIIGEIVPDHELVEAL